MCATIAAVNEIISRFDPFTHQDIISKLLKLRNQQYGPKSTITADNEASLNTTSNYWLTSIERFILENEKFVKRFPNTVTTILVTYCVIKMGLAYRLNNGELGARALVICFCSTVWCRFLFRIVGTIDKIYYTSYLKNIILKAYLTNFNMPQPKELSYDKMDMLNKFILKHKTGFMRLVMTLTVIILSCATIIFCFAHIPEGMCDTWIVLFMGVYLHAASCFYYLIVYDLVDGFLTDIVTQRFKKFLYNTTMGYSHDD